MTALIEIKNITKRFGAAVAVNNVSLQVRDKEFLALLGPSGCGKTTLLRMLGGFEQPSAGDIIIDGKDMRGLPPNKRPVNMVFQSYAIFPHMTARENIAYGLKVVRTPKRETEERVAEALALVRMEKFADYRPDNLSGGQRQRIALARALVKKPKVLLLDEPLSALDAKLRDVMRAELVNLQKTVGVTFVIVTHDQDEALSMAGRIAVMRDGEIKQVDAPRALYESPSSKFVADFIGRMNILPAKKTPPPPGETGEHFYDIEGLGAYPVLGGVAATAESAAGNTAKMVAAIRPEKISLGEPSPGECGAKGALASVSYRGGETLLTIKCDAGATLTVTVSNKSRAQTPPAPGQQLSISWSPQDIIALPD